MSPQPRVEEVARLAKKLGRPLTDAQADLLTVYLGLLVKWNSRMNLVGPATWPEVLENLIQDSWHLGDLLHTLDPAPGETLDLGAGAGLPGIPLRVFWTQGEYWLVEPRQKRALFMEQAIAHMKLPRTRVSCCRMEALPQSRRQAGLIVSRAFMPWRKLLDAVRGFLAPDGRVVIMGNDAPQEPVDGYELDRTVEYTIAGKKRYFRLFVFRGEGV